MNKEEKIKKYIELILEFNKKINLISKKDEPLIYERHIKDSLFPSNFFDFSNKKAIDIGSGAGFPGVPLAIFFPSLYIELYEPIKKRANFLTIVKENLSLNNVEIKNDRIENRNKNEKVDVVLSRATFSLPILLELSVPFLKVNGILISYKGEKYQDEINLSSNALKILNSRVIDIKFKDEKNKKLGVNLFIKKEEETSKLYPRNFSIINKKPL